MGRHYLPQRYLRHFAVPGEPDMIWMYDKRSGKASKLAIKTVAQSPDFYTDEDEQALAQRIEGPAEAPLNRLRDGQRIDVGQREVVAVYLESMTKRVPSFRRLLLQLIREDGGEALDEIKKDPQRWASQRGLNFSPEQILRDVEKWEAGFERKSISLKDDLLRGQWTTPLMVRTLLEMTWRITRTDRSAGFLTGDNPMFFHKAYGLRKAEAEITFPLSSCVALNGSWDEPKGALLFGEAEPPLIKEINRRVIASAGRFLFFHKDTDWVWKVANKPHIRLNRIQW